MKKAKELLKSRKFLIACLGVIAVVAKETLGLDPSQTESIGTIVIGWLLSHGAVDAVKELK